MGDEGWKEVVKEYNSLQGLCNSPISTNYERRHLFARCELLTIEIERLAPNECGVDQETEAGNMVKHLSEWSSKLDLRFVHRKSRNIVGKLLSVIDEFVRLVGAWSFLALSSVLIALPCLLLYPLDYFLLKQKIITPHNQLNSFGKRFIASSMMKLSGIYVVTEGLNQNDFGNECVIACFSHASTMDAFLISATIPVRALTMGKADLFLIPFFSWCLMAFGGVPIDRNNRGQAVSALREAAEAATEGQCVSIAPEGTRSKSGNITTFKKGPFHMWEQLKTPIIPMVIFGAFDLFPPGKNISIPGKVYVRFLDPILASEAPDRAAMSTLVRKRMLEAWRDGPKDAADDLTLPQRLEHWGYLVAFYAFLAGLWMKFPVRELLKDAGMSMWQGVGAFVLASMAITLWFYVYLMYISKWLKTFTKR